jgi:hypothetical protein
MRPALRRRLAIVTASVVTLVLAGYVALGRSPWSSDRTSSCIADVPHFVDDVAALNGFSIDVDEGLPMTIGRGSPPGVSPPAYVSDYQAGRMVGYVANIAVTGLDRPGLNAAARSLGYQIGKWPLVPLVGPVVQHNPGLLETYVTVVVFKSTAGSRSWLSFKSMSFAQAGYTTLTSPNNRIAISVEGILGNNDGIHEHILIHEVPLANTVLQLAYQGGSGLSQAEVAAETNTAIGRFVQACGQS